MKTETPDPLLSAVFDDEAAFRRATLEQTVTLARRRRRVRFARRAVSIVAVLIVAALLLRPTPRVTTPEPLAEVPALRVIHSATLAADESVRTRSALFHSVATVPASLVIVASEPNAFARIETRTDAPMLDYLDDRQLLAAFPGEHPLLLAPGTREARVVFAK